MPNFKQITQNYTELYASLYINPSIRSKESRVDSKGVFERDLPRTSYFSKNLSAEEIKQYLETEFFSDDKNDYTQGCLDGGLLQIHTQNYYFMMAEHISEHNLYIRDMTKTIRVCYVNDENILCAFSIQIFQDLTTEAPNVFHYAIAVYQNITNQSAGKNVTYIADSRLLNTNLVNEKDADDIPSDQVLRRLGQALKSAVLLNAIVPIIAGKDYASKPAFDKLNTCLKTNSNGYANVLELGYQHKLNIIGSPKKDAMLNQSYFQRHRSMIFVLAVSVLIGISAIAAIIFVVPLVIGIPVVVLSVVASGLAQVQCRRDEQLLQSYKIKRDDAKSKVTDQYNRDVAAMNSSSESIPQPPGFFRPIIVNQPDSEEMGDVSTFDKKNV